MDDLFVRYPHSKTFKAIISTECKESSILAVEREANFLIENLGTRQLEDSVVGLPAEDGIYHSEIKVTFSRGWTDLGYEYDFDIEIVSNFLLF